MKPKPGKAARDARKRARALRSIFLLLTLLGLIINLDGGAVPASVDVIREHFALLPWQVGLLGSLVYFGTAAGSVVAGSVVGRLSPLSATRAAVVLNTCATAGFGLAPNTALLLIFRFSIGLLQATPLVYFPVWVDEFAPKSAATKWMACIQGGAPLGITFGYVFAGILTKDAAAALAAKAVRSSRPPPACSWRRCRPTSAA